MVRIGSRFRRVTLSFSLSLSMACAPVSATTLFNAGLDLRYNDNLSNGQLPNDIKDDYFAALQLSGGRYIQLPKAVGVNFIAYAKAEAYQTYRLINSYTLGAQVAIRKKFGLGIQAPVLRASLDVGHLEARDKLRDRWIYQAELSLQKRLGDRLLLGLTYNHTQMEQDNELDIPVLVQLFGIHGNVFDLSSDQLSATLMFRATEQLSLLGGYARRSGGIVASTVPDINLVSIYQKGAFDPAFGPGVVAYTIDADSDIYTAGFSWALNPHASLNLDYARRESQADRGFDYTNNIFGARLLYAF